MRAQYALGSFLLCLVLLQASGSITPEHHANAQKLLRDNLQPVIAFWHELRTTHGKLTMQNWFKTANRNLRSRHVAFWGVFNNKVVQLNKDGEMRYSNDAMMLEGIPNRGAAGGVKPSTNALLMLKLTIQIASMRHASFVAPTR